jgi:NADH-quinone oxidoreductase subunit M
MLVSIAAVVLWMGIYPESFLAPMRKDVGVLLARIDRAKPPGDAQLARGSGAAPAHAAATPAHQQAAGAH